ncbi:COMM domain-containing protein 4 [Lemmus lemmus]
MRFRFCGDLDCPDWVLAEISTLAKISSVKLRLLCSQVLKELLGQGIDYEKILKLTADAKFESGDVKATVAVLSFILSSAAKHSVDSDSLSSELQQLGLPRGMQGDRQVGNLWGGLPGGYTEASWALDPETHHLSPMPGSTCHLNRAPPQSSIYLQSTPPACAAVLKRSRSPYRNTFGPAACV